jgi:hypothetical protein
MQASSECIMQLILPDMHIVMIKIASGIIDCRLKIIVYTDLSGNI